MAQFKIAHIREQGVDMIIVPRDSSFGRKSDSDQKIDIAALQACATAAGLAGTVVPAWLEGGRPKFIAPQNWHARFRTVSWEHILASINKELTCS